MKKDDLKGIIAKWVNGDVDEVRKMKCDALYDQIDNSESWPVLYRYIENVDQQIFMAKKYGSGIDPIYQAKPGDIIKYDLISATVSTPAQAWDDWFTPKTNVIKIKSAKGIDISKYDDKFLWEKEILTYGEFRLIGIRPMHNSKLTDYTQYILEYSPSNKNE